MNILKRVLPATLLANNWRKSMIDKLAFIYIKNSKLLLARSKGSDAYFIPGGKREEGETDAQALKREIQEELSVSLNEDTLKPMGVFTAQAHGKPAGTLVQMTCYSGDFEGTLQASAEIEEIAWYKEGMPCSLVTQQIVDWLKSNNLIASQEKNPTNYDWVLFDADETLFRFDDLRGLKNMFKNYAIEFTEQDYKEYKEINSKLWKDYQNGIITADEIRQKRFKQWGERLGKTSMQLNSDFLTAMANICEPLEGTVSLLNSLKGKVKMGIITNGFTEWQEIRLERLGLTEHINLVVTSEQAGVAKPHRNIFNHALSRMDNPSRERVLMVGDTFESDIKGGIDSGLHTCWFNAHNKPLTADTHPTYQVTSLSELEIMLLGQANTHKSSQEKKSFPFWLQNKDSANRLAAEVPSQTLEEETKHAPY